MSVEPIARKGFQGWLDEQDADAVVGYSNHPGCCPLASYLLVLDPDADVGVWPGQKARIVINGETYGLAMWSRRFAGMIDARWVQKVAVTAKDALLALKRVDRLFQ